MALDGPQVFTAQKIASIRWRIFPSSGVLGLSSRGVGADGCHTALLDLRGELAVGASLVTQDRFAASVGSIAVGAGRSRARRPSGGQLQRPSRAVRSDDRVQPDPEM
jgi:hypothetical protein